MMVRVTIPVRGDMHMDYVYHGTVVIEDETAITILSGYIELTFIKDRVKIERESDGN